MAAVTSYLVACTPEMDLRQQAAVRAQGSNILTHPGSAKLCASGPGNTRTAPPDMQLRGWAAAPVLRTGNSHSVQPSLPLGVAMSPDSGVPKQLYQSDSARDIIVHVGR